MLNRRNFLLALVATGFTPLAIARAEPQVRFLSVRGDPRKRYYISGIDSEGGLMFDLPLPERAHGIAVHPSGALAMVIARRPGRFLQPVDLLRRRLLKPIGCGDQRHLYGHGVYSPDGALLYTTENDFDAGRGVIAVRDANDGYRQVAEFDSGGIGPHELRLLSGGDILVVANGGIRTHPDFDRTPLNLEGMRPSLTYIDRRRGQILESRELPASLHQNSIRHLAVGSEDRVCVAMQYQGPSNEQPPLVALHRRGGPLILLTPPDDVLEQMRNYCGSVCADATGDCFAVSSPRGDLITFWSAAGGHFLGRTSVKDGCGIAAGASAGEFLLSSGGGGLYRYRLADGTLSPLPQPRSEGIMWDNHIAGI